LGSMKDRALDQNYLRAEDGVEIEGLMSRGNYLMAAEAIRYGLPADEYETFLVDSFDPPGVKPARVHKALLELRSPMYITTNYDRLIENAYAQEYGESAVVVTHQNSYIAQKSLQSGRLRERPIVFKIHGSIDEPSELILSERDYRKLTHQSQGYRMVLSAVFITHTVLMLGFSFADPELRLLLETHREALKYRTHPDYLFAPEDSMGQVEMRRLRDDFGVSIITYQPSPDHREVVEFVEFLASHVPPAA